MDKELYLNNLSDEIAKQGYGDYYCAKCTRYASHLIDNNLPVIFDTKHLSLLIGIDTHDLTKMVFSEERYYTQTKIPKKSNGFRELDMPAVELKYIQRWILNNILYSVKISDCAVGFCIKKSIVNNAKRHINQYCIVNMDIKDFFPTISFERVYRIFAYYGYTNEVSFVLAKLCTFGGKLPQGSPASPYISNISCLKLDARLNALAKAYESKYSRYADDITFSSQNDIKSIIKATTDIISNEGFAVNDKKTRVAYPYQRQEVTGLLVNGDHVRVSKKYKRDLYQEIYYCSKFGVQDHMKQIGCNKAFYKEHIYGKIYFINMVEPEEAKKLFILASQIQWDY
ncbi:MAG: retron St85 family RNA-directed DNA polymerase [Oscillibacter sp.]|nr:retron St85 family RNA-directed DNA polymerase [Oscillibacter sp.]